MSCSHSNQSLCANNGESISESPTLFKSNDLGYGNFAPDLWNISPTSDGSISMSLDANGKLTTKVNFSSTNFSPNRCNFNPFKLGLNCAVIGYPNVGYGWNIYRNESLSGNTSHVLPIGCDTQGNQCVRLKDMPPLISLTNYTMIAGSVPVDAAYDIWMTPGNHDTTAQPNGLELMVWLDYANNMDQYLTSQMFCRFNLGFCKVQTFTSDLYVNGTIKPMIWDVYFWNEQHGSILTPYQYTTAFILPHNPISSGVVGLDLKKMIDVMQTDRAKHHILENG